MDPERDRRFSSVAWLDSLIIANLSLGMVKDEVVSIKDAFMGSIRCLLLRFEFRIGDEQWTSRVMLLSLFSTVAAASRCPDM